MLKILAVTGWVLLAVLVLLLWILIVPRSIYVEYSKKYNLIVKVRVFLFKIKVYPFKLPFAKELTEEQKTAKKEAKKARKAKKAEKKQSDKKPTTEQQQKKKGFDIAEKLPKGMELAKTILSTVKGVFRILLNGIRIKDVSFNLPISGKDAFDVQQKYGKITSAFYSFNIFLQKYVKVFYKCPKFIADFNNLYRESLYFYCKIQASPSIIIAVGWHLLKIYLNLNKNSKNTTDKAEKEN